MARGIYLTAYREWDYMDILNFDEIPRQADHPQSEILYKGLDTVRFLESRFPFFRSQPLHPQEPGAVVKIHQSGRMSCPDKTALQVIKKDRAIRPGVPFVSQS